MTDTDVLVEDDLSGESSVADERTRKILADIRAENAKRRIQNRELSQQREQLLADLQAAQDSADRLKAELDQNREVLNREKEARQRELDITAAANQAVVDGLPERLRPIVPTDYDPFKLRAWLDAAVPALKVTVPPTDGEPGSRGDRGNATVAVGQDELDFAKMLGVDPQQLVKEMQRKKTDSS